MSQIVHRLCAEVVVDRNGQRLFPLGKKKIPQKEVRLVEINRSPPGKPTWRTGRLEIGPIGQNSEAAEWSTGLETLNKIDKQFISKGSLILTLKKTNNVPSLGFQSMDEITMIILRQADSQNLTTLMNMVDSLMTTGSVKRRESAAPKPIAPPAPPARPTSDFPVSGFSAAAKPAQKVEAGSKWELPKHLAEMGNIPANSTVVNKISLREHRLMKLGLSESEDELDKAHKDNQRLKELPIHKQSVEIKSERARFEMLYSQLFLHKILAYLTPKESTLLGLINKKCHALYCSMRRELNYSRFTEIPENHLLSLIKKCNKVERIVWGKLQGFKSVADKFSSLQLNNLISMDCSAMSDFKDTTVIMFTRFAPNLKELSVPYYSLTSHSMLLMVKEFPRLEVFRALHFGNHRSSGVLNEKLSAKSVSEFLFNKPYLCELEMFCLESSSLKAEIATESATTIRPEAKVDSSFSSIRSESCPAVTVKGLVRSLTIHNLLARTIGNLSQLEQLGSQFPSLQTLVIGSIYMTPFQQIPSPPSSTFKNVLSKLPPNLTGLGLGEFVDDEILASVPRSVRELSINSPHVTDEGLGALLLQIHPRRLDLRGCMLISWEAFKSLEPIVVPPVTPASSSHLFGGGFTANTDPTNKPGLREIILRGEKSRAEEIQLFLREKGFRGCRVVNYEPTRG